MNGKDKKYYSFELFGNARINTIIRCIFIIVIVVVIDVILISVKGNSNQETIQEDSYYKEYLEILKTSPQTIPDEYSDVITEISKQSMIEKSDFVYGHSYKGKSGQIYVCIKGGELLFYPYGALEPMKADQALLAKEFGIKIENDFGVCRLFDNKIYIYDENDEYITKIFPFNKEDL